MPDAGIPNMIGVRKVTGTSWYLYDNSYYIIPGGEVEVTTATELEVGDNSILEIGSP